MNYINSYVRAKEFCLKEFVPERKKVIHFLKELRDEIQRVTKNQKTGCVVYSSVGVLSGGALILSLLAGPMTAGVSTVMTFGGMASGVVDIAHRGLKWATIRKLVENAVSTLDAHETTFSNLTQDFLLKLKEDIETIKDKIETIKMIKCDEEKEILVILKDLQFTGILIAIPQNPSKVFNITNDKMDFIFHLLLSDSLVCRGLSLTAKHFAYKGAYQIATDVAKKGAENGSYQIAKEGIKESAKDLAKKGAKNGATQVAKGGIKEGAKNLAKNGAKNGATQVAKGGIKEGAKDLAKNGAKNGAKQIAKEGAKECAKDFSKAFTYASVGVSICLDLKSLFLSARDLSRFSAGELCAEAEKLNSFITKMEYELKYLNKWFEDMSSE